MILLNAAEASWGLYQLIFVCLFAFYVLYLILVGLKIYKKRNKVAITPIGEGDIT